MGAQLALDLSQPVAHYEQLHADPHGTVVLWHRRAPKGSRWPKVGPTDPAAVILAHESGQQDRYFSVSEFREWRTVGQLMSLRACYVDVDGTDNLEAVMECLDRARMPAPSFAVRSGHGLHLYWLLEPAPAKALGGWQPVQNALIEALAPVGADPAAKDCTRVLRLAGSQNSDTGTTVTGYIVSGERWTLRGLGDEVLGHRQPGLARRKSANVRALAPRQRSRRVGQSIYQRWYLVYRDLDRIAAHNWWGGIPEGHRDTWLFLTGVALSWFVRDEALQAEIEAIARSWTPTLSEAEVKTYTKPILDRARRAAQGETITWEGRRVDPRYRFRRQTLWAWLRPVIPDELVPELRAIIPDSEARRRKQARDAARYQDHYTGAGYRAGNAEKVRQARAMVAQGVSIRKTSRQLGVSATAVSKWLRESA